MLRLASHLLKQRRISLSLADDYAAAIAGISLRVD